MVIMSRKKILGILSLVLLVFAFMSGVEAQSGYSMGDNILRFVGIKAWSKETAEHIPQGFHNTFLLSLGLFALGYTGAKHYLKEIYPKLVDRLPAIAFFLFLTASPLFNWGYGIVLSSNKGINSVIYMPRQSSYHYQNASSLSNSEITNQYHIMLRNYSNDVVKFNMQVQKPTGSSFAMEDVTETDSQGQQTLKEFTLQPGEIKNFEFTLETRDTNIGGGNSPNITIYDGQSSRQFKYHSLDY